MAVVVWPPEPSLRLYLHFRCAIPASTQDYSWRWRYCRPVQRLVHTLFAHRASARAFRKECPPGTSHLSLAHSFPSRLRGSGELIRIAWFRCMSRPEAGGCRCCLAKASEPFVGRQSHHLFGRRADILAPARDTTADLEGGAGAP